MKRISHTFRARDRLLHIETELGIINIYTGLHDHKGSVMERIDIIPDDYAGEPEVRMEGSRTVILKQRREFE